MSASIPLKNYRCVRCGRSKTPDQFSGLYPVCLECSSFESKKPIKAFCLKCHKPIYESTPHVIGMQSEFTEFVRRSCFNEGKYRPSGELNYYKLCRSCKEYFYTYDDRQKFCTPQCYLAEKKYFEGSPVGKTHDLEKNEVLSSGMVGY